MRCFAILFALLCDTSLLCQSFVLTDNHHTQLKLFSLSSNDDDEIPTPVTDDQPLWQEPEGSYEATLTSVKNSSFENYLKSDSFIEDATQEIESLERHIELPESTPPSSSSNLFSSMKQDRSGMMKSFFKKVSSSFGDLVKATASAASDKVKKQMHDLESEVKQIPHEVEKALEQKKIELEHEIKQIPTKAEKKALDIIEDVKEAATEIEYEIKQLPEKTEETVKHTAINMIEDAKEAVETNIKNVEYSVENLINPKNEPKTPRPPRVPPPPELTKDLSSNMEKRKLSPHPPKSPQQQQQQRLVETYRKREAQLERKRKRDEEREVRMRQKTEDKQKFLEEKKKTTSSFQKRKNEQLSKAKDILENAKPGATISLLGLFGQDQSDVKDSDSSHLSIETPTQAKNALDKPPTGIKTISKWMQNPDKTITGEVKTDLLRSMFGGEKVEVITTSPIKGRKKPEGGTIIETTNGSKYFLEHVDDKDAAKRAAAVAAEAKKREKVLSEAEPGATISLLGLFDFPVPNSPQISQSSSESSSVGDKSVKFMKRAPLGVPTITKWSQTRDGRIIGIVNGSFTYGPGDRITTSPVKGKVEGGTVVMTSSGSRYFLHPTSKATPEEAKQAAAESALHTAKPGATISLLGLFDFPVPNSPQISQSSSESSSVGDKSVKFMKRAPLGVPTITKWSQTRDGRIIGIVNGSFTYGAGDRVTTSPVKGRVEGGTVVMTSSGSRYFLHPTSKATPDEAKQAAAESALHTAKPGATISLFNFLNDQTKSFMTATSPESPPKGVTVISEWSQSSDGRITGLVKGSNDNNFPYGKGERITTSTIKQSVVKSGVTVTTSSGTRYYLE